ncbi:MAG: hypothetical protein EAZ36_03450, partial [Verrucomicrobia bacterium]
MIRSLPVFLLGFLVGGVALWIWPRATSARHPSAAPETASSRAPLALPAWSWRDRATPPPLPTASVDRAITAWLALRKPDPDSANFTHRAETLHALLSYLPTHAYPRLLDALLPHATPHDRLLLDLAYQRYAALDPAGAARWAVAAKSGPDFVPFTFAQIAIKLWVKADPNAVADWLKSLKDRDFATALSGQMITTLAQVDPASALRTFGPDLWDNGKNLWVLRPALTAWAKHDPAAVLAWMIAQPRPNDRALGEWIGAISAEADPKAMLAAIAAVPAMPHSENAQRQVLASWGQKEPAAALAWAQSNPDRHQRNELIEQLSYQRAEGNDPQILSFALAMPEGQRRTARLGDLLEKWAERDAPAALSWIREQKDSSVAIAATKAQAAILGVIARDEPATAITEWGKLTDAETKRAALAPILKAWSENDPGAALRWLRTQPESVSRTAGTFFYV